MSNSTNKAIADKEAASSHHVDERSHPGHQTEGKDERARKLEVEVKRNAKKK
jgi:hypothetical protein